jgi:hypothetical protein
MYYLAFLMHAYDLSRSIRLGPKILKRNLWKPSLIKIRRRLLKKKLIEMSNKNL